MNIAVGQSGGPTCAINASLAGVVEEIRILGGKAYGAKNGIDGVICNAFRNLTDLSDSQLRLLKQTPSAALGSCRTKLPSAEVKPELYQTIFENLSKRGIDAFLYIGGNDSMDTVAKLQAYAMQINSDIRFVGIPKTVDNDLPETDHTPGFGSAARYVTVTTQEITRDSSVYDVNSVTIIEIMGRDAGWLTASVCALDTPPHLVYLPEVPFCVETFLATVNQLHQNGIKNVIVAVSEGVKTACGEYVGSESKSGKSDVFGHKYLAGVGRYLESQVSEKLGCKVRAVELNVCQRCASHVASESDLIEAEAVARAAVNAAKAKYSGVMMTIQRTSDDPYAVEYKPVEVCAIANNVRLFPTQWINKDGNGIVPEAKGYFAPLVGELLKHFIMEDSDFG